MNQDALDNHGNKMPRFMLWIVLTLSALPFLISLTGIDFGRIPGDLTSVTGGIDAVYAAFAGVFVHTILEWTAVSIAILTVIMALFHYAEKGEVTTPIMGVALFMAGVLDAYHILGADRLIAVGADADQFMALTWLMSRTFLAVAILIGAAVFPMTEPARAEETRRRGFGAIVGAALFFGIVAIIAIKVTSGMGEIPSLLRIDGLLHRPWNLVPAALFLVVGAYVLPTYFVWRASVFTHALIISMVPHGIAELHMAFGSSAAFDHHFYLAHFLKAVAYAIPLIGLMLDYKASHQREVRSEEKAASAVLESEQAQEALKRDRSILRLLLKEMDRGVMIKDTSLRIARINQALATLTGVQSPMDVIGLTEVKLWDEAYAAASKQEDEEILRTGEPATSSGHRVQCKDRTLMIDTTKLPMKNNQGEVTGIVVLYRSTGA